MPEDTKSFGESRQRLLTRFFDAVAAGDLSAAVGATQQLREGLHLDALNLRFLEIYAYASVGAWKEISDRPDFDSLLEAPKPVDIARALFEALYRREVADQIDAGQIDIACKTWIEVRRTRLRNPIPAFTGGSVQVARLYALDALTTGVQPPWRADLLAYDLGPLATAFTAMFPNLPPPPTANIDPLLAAFGALVAARDGSLAEKCSALDAVKKLGPIDSKRLLGAPGFAALLDEVRFEVTEQPPTNWSEWVNQLANQKFVERASTIASQAANEWTHANAFKDPSSFADALKICATNELSRDAVRCSLPHLVRWFRLDPECPRSTWRPLYLGLVEIYALAGTDWIDGEARGAALSMVDCFLATGPSAPEYRMLLEYIRELLPEAVGPSGAPWLLDLIELILRYDAPDVAQRDAFCRDVLNTLRPVLGRLSDGLRISAHASAVLVNWPWPESVADTTGTQLETGVTLAAKLAGRTVAIYTLVERAAEQARNLLTMLAPKVRVEVLADHGNSPRLTQLARSADVFVMVTWAAKHAATDAIRAARPKSLPLLMPSGKGASSIIDAIEQWAKGPLIQPEVQGSIH
jgi:hypothetical protein